VTSSAEFAGVAYQRDHLLIIPTHNHAETLALAVQSAQNQTEQDLGIVVIGDGVTDDSRDAIAPIVKSDNRVSFLDRAKAVRHGEEYRDEVIRASKATTIAYSGDDDLLFPDHIENLSELLTGVDFVNSLPIFINPDGTLTHLPSDLSLPESVSWHLDPNERRNTVSLTGVMHTRSSYLGLPFGWRPAPTGRWTDHYMWEQYFSMPNFTARTSTRATTAKFAQDAREGMTAIQRGSELKEFARQMSTTGFVEQWNARVRECERQTIAWLALEKTSLNAQLASAVQRGEELSAEIDAIRQECERLRVALDISDKRSDEIAATVEAMVNSKSWKITAPLRKLRAALSPAAKYNQSEFGSEPLI
jgi:hypothetical protein